MLKEYKEFVDSVATGVCKGNKLFIYRLKELIEDYNLDISRIELALHGLAGETGELSDSWKKVLFHGKEFNQNEFIKEMGDVIWYWTLLCIALDINAKEVMKKNIEKLEERYPGRKFKNGN